MCPERIIDSVVAREGTSYEQEIRYFPGLSSNGAKKLPKSYPQTITIDLPTMKIG
jgi:hypothetical protein